VDAALSATAPWASLPASEVTQEVDKK
jgi:hypothetical protein